MTQSLKSNDDLRDEFKKIARRMRTTLTALSQETVGNNTLAGFVMRPTRQRGLALKTLLAFLGGIGHEIVFSRPDLPETGARTSDDIREFLVVLGRQSGKSISGMCVEAGLSLSLVGWVTGTSQAKTIYVEPLLKLLDTQKVTVKIVKIAATKRAAKNAMLTGR